MDMTQSARILDAAAAAALALLKHDLSGPELGAAVSVFVVMIAASVAHASGDPNGSSARVEDVARMARELPVDEVLLAMKHRIRGLALTPRPRRIAGPAVRGMPRGRRN
jgi:hypothetical protein